MNLFLSKPLRPALLLLLIFLCGALGLWWLASSAARDVDSESLRVTQLALKQELAREKRLLAVQLLDYSVWNDMFEHVSREQPDLEWLHENLTESIYHNQNVHVAMLIDSSRGVLMARQDGILSPTPNKVLPLADHQWLALLRNAERYTQGGDGLQGSQLLRVDKVNPVTGYPEPHILVLSIQRVRPEFAYNLQQSPPRYLLFGRYLDNRGLRQLADDFLLPNMQLYFTTDSPDGLSSLPLQDANGQVLAWLGWSPRTPGNLSLIHI